MREERKGDICLGLIQVQLPSFQQIHMEATAAASFLAKPALPTAQLSFNRLRFCASKQVPRSRGGLVVRALDGSSSRGAGGGGGGGTNGGGGKTVGGVPTSASSNSNYVVPLDKRSSSTSSIVRPLSEILRDLNKRVPDNIIDPHTNTIPWYHVNRMLSFYAPGWCGEIRDIFSGNGSVTVVYRVTIRGSDGEAHREAAGTVSSTDGLNEDPVAAAEEIAFCKACARFGFGLHLYHEDEVL